MKNLVEVKNLKKNYDSKEAVKNISFNIKENEVLGLLGPNGSGKTTTIGMMLGLLKPSSGEILINGKKIEENRIETLQKINFISPYIELPKKLTVKQNLIVYCKLYNVLDIKSRIEYLVDNPIWLRGGVAKQWRLEKTKIPAEALGQKIRLEFNFSTDGGQDNGPQAGWFIDDVAITTK